MCVPVTCQPVSSCYTNLVSCLAWKDYPRYMDMRQLCLSHRMAPQSVLICQLVNWLNLACISICWPGATHADTPEEKKQESLPCWQVRWCLHGWAGQWNLGGRHFHRALPWAGERLGLLSYTPVMPDFEKIKSLRLRVLCVLSLPWDSGTFPTLSPAEPSPVR